jgi:hypothetical protein
LIVFSLLKLHTKQRKKLSRKTKYVQFLPKVQTDNILHTNKIITKREKNERMSFERFQRRKQNREQTVSDSNHKVPKLHIQIINKTESELELKKEFWGILSFKNIRKR